jgi:DNA mismatch repair protein MutL
MNTPNPNISNHPPKVEIGSIRQLDDAAINRIAAGEVVERPASAVKELIENSLDAGAHRIEITIADGGKSLIRVADDGHGIRSEELPLALSRHATSKIDGSDLLNIHSFGFRGEALPSLGAVGRLDITSQFGSENAAHVSVVGGAVSPIRPAALSAGTVVELRDLFFATPARLKFLRTDRAEMQAITETVKRLAMAQPYVSFILRDSSGDKERIVFRSDAECGQLFDALDNRLRGIIGKDFTENSIRIDAERDGFFLTGFAALPTYSRGSAVAQYLFVNGRPVRDKLLVGALRGAYADFLSRDRHPAAVLFIECDPTLVDVNVHPAKSEVRFRNSGVVRGLVVSGIRHALASAGHRASTTVASATLGAFRPEQQTPKIYQMDRPEGHFRTHGSYESQSSDITGGFAEMAVPSARVEPVLDMTTEETATYLPLGAARAQIHENYIISQTKTGFIIVDQHAAHERLVYEKLKGQMENNGVVSQALLIPEIVELSETEIEQLFDFDDDFKRLGLVIERFGGNAIAVRETPAILGTLDAKKLLHDILDELCDLQATSGLKGRIEAILSRIACHGSIRSGRQMRAEEMNALLREMESTPHSGQCNHGRPTYVELKLSDIERLFGRT